MDAVAGKTIEELEASQATIKARLKEIDADYAGQQLPDDARTEWNTLNTELEAAESLAGELRARQERVKALSTDDRHLDRQPDPARSSHRTGARKGPDDVFDVAAYRQHANSQDELVALYREGAMRAVDGAVFSNPDVNPETAKGNVARLLATIDGGNDDQPGGVLARRILNTGSDLYRRAFGKYLVGAMLNADEQRALSLTTTAGGFAVPYTLDPTVLLTSNGVVNPVRSLARIETITGNTWSGISSAGVTAVYTAEATEVADGAPTIAQPTATVEKAQSMVAFSIEIGQDWSSMQSEMAKLFADAKDTLEADKFLTGGGHTSTVPEGLHRGGTQVVTAAATVAFSVADVYALETGLAPRWRPQATYVGNRAIFNRVRQFDTGGGGSLWVQLQYGAPPTLIGYPAAEWSNMATSLQSSSSILSIGDFSQFLIVDRVGMDVELIPHLFATANNLPSGQRALYCYWRNTSKVLVPEAFKTLKTF